MVNDIYINKRDLLYNVCAFAILLSSCLLYIVDDSNKYISVLSTALTILFCFKFLRTLPFLVLFAYLSMYTYESTKFFFTGILLSANRSFQTPDIINKMLEINNLFVFSLGAVIPSRVSRIELDLKKYQFESGYIFWGLVIIGLLMIQFGIKGDSLLSGKGYATGSSQKSTLHEYFLLVYFLMLLVYPRKNFVAKLMINALFFIFCFKTLIFGGRIEVMEIGILFLYFFWALRKRVNKPLFFSLVVVGLYFNSVFSAIRGNPLILVKGDYGAILNPFSSFGDRKPKLPYLLSNEGDVIQSSTRLLGLIQEGYLTLENRLLSLVTYFFSFLLPGSLWPDYTNLSRYKQDVYGSGGGGMIGAYFYVWMGYAGPVIVGLFLGVMFRRMYLSKNIYYKIYGTCLLFTMPRWYAYSPVFLIKFIVYTLVLYWLLKLFYGTFLKRRTGGMGDSVFITPS